MRFSGRMHPLNMDLVSECVINYLPFNVDSSIVMVLLVYVTYDQLVRFGNKAYIYIYLVCVYTSRENYTITNTGK